MSEKIKETIAASDVGALPAGIISGETYGVTCAKCHKVTVVKGVLQPGQNQGHFICAGCQGAHNKAETKKMLDKEAPTVNLDGRAAQGATLVAAK